MLIIVNFIAGNLAVYRIIFFILFTASLSQSVNFCLRGWLFKIIAGTIKSIDDTYSKKHCTRMPKIVLGF